MMVKQNLGCYNEGRSEIEESENRVLKRIFGPKGNEGTENWGK
jgi:hypothetical protein